MTTVERYLLQVLVTLALVAGLFWLGWSFGQQAMQADINRQTLDALNDAALRRDRGYKIAAQYEKQLTNLQADYAKLQRKRRAADALPVQCPASGAVGDVVVPAGFVDSMFNRTGPVQPSNP